MIENLRLYIWQCISAPYGKLVIETTIVNGTIEPQAEVVKLDNVHKIC